MNDTHFASVFGPFGAELSEQIADKVAALGRKLDDGEAFDAAYAEIAEIADDLFTKYLETFARTLTGFLTFHAQNNLALGRETPSQAMGAIAVNATRILAQIQEMTMVNAQHYLFGEMDRMSQVVKEMVQEMLDLEGWTEERGEHPLTDLFPGKPVA